MRPHMRHSNILGVELTLHQPENPIWVPLGDIEGNKLRLLPFQYVHHFAHRKAYMRATRAHARRPAVSSLVRLHINNCSLADVNAAFLMDMLLAAPRLGRPGVRK